MIIGMGLDLCPIARGEKMLASERFMERVFTPSERAYIAARGALGAQSAAGLFAAKEAVLKALGTGLGGGLLNVEIAHTREGAPRCVLHGALLGARVHVTITHDGGMAAAAAIAEEE